MDKDKNQYSGLQKSNNSLSLVTRISNPVDLLKALPIQNQIRNYGEEAVIMNIAPSIEKLAYSLNIKMEKIQLVTLCEDIMECYPYDSIEDVRECLKKARQGEYSFGHHQRGVISMPLIRDWMSIHLEKKAQIRERQIHNAKQTESVEKYQNVDYQAFKKRQAENGKEKKGDDKYNNFKAKYLASKQKEDEEEQKTDEH